MSEEEIKNLKEITEKGIDSFEKIINYLGEDDFIDKYLSNNNMDEPRDKEGL